VDVVVVVSAFVGLPDDLDAKACDVNVDEAAVARPGDRLRLGPARDDERGGGDSVADWSVIGAAVGCNAEVEGVARGVV
jgi:hypothetical protein